MEIQGLSLAERMKLGQVEQRSMERTQPANGDTKKTSFAELLEQHIEEANTAGIESDHRIARALEGKEVNNHATVISLQKADVTFRLMLSVKDKLEQAYQQLIRTQVG